LSIESSPSIDPKKGVCVFGALGLLGGNGPKTPKPQTPKPLSLDINYNKQFDSNYNYFKR